MIKRTDVCRKWNAECVSVFHTLSTLCCLYASITLHRTQLLSNQDQSLGNYTFWTTIRAGLAASGNAKKGALLYSRWAYPIARIIGCNHISRETAMEACKLHSSSRPTLERHRLYPRSSFPLCVLLLAATSPARSGESGLSGRRTKSSLKHDGLTGMTPFSLVFLVGMKYLIRPLLGLGVLDVLFFIFESALWGRPFFLPPVSGGVEASSLALVLADMAQIFEGGYFIRRILWNTQRLNGNGYKLAVMLERSKAIISR